jgi:hypothetical protein
VPPRANGETPPECKVMKAIEEDNLPTPRPENCTDTISKLWDLFEACWSKEGYRRRDAVTVCQFLEENKEKLVVELEK